MPLDYVKELKEFTPDDQRKMLLERTRQGSTSVAPPERSGTSREKRREEVRASLGYAFR